ncbi:hypothetical protein KIS4809_3411 [Bacillus sp. ZZV12-4809]|nr:hypothetical protein KIS4809_3411 [Bacillus sp. ZZV12-4809]
MISLFFLPHDKSYQNKTIFIRKKQKTAILTNILKKIANHQRICNIRACMAQWYRS